MMPPGHIEFSIPSHPVFLQMVRAVMKKAGEMVNLPEDQTGLIVLGVDEASSNVIKYAYDNDPGGRLDYIITLKTDRMDISITDYGKACDLPRLRPRDINELRPGGLGIYIINEVMDQVVYACGKDNKNQIRMTKFFARGHKKPPARSGQGG